MELITLILAAIGCLLGAAAFVKMMRQGSGPDTATGVDEALETLVRRQECSR
jgi:hypothetical protein